MLLSTFQVTNALDGGGAGPAGSLRFAITQANLPGNEGSTVQITPQAGPVIALTAGELPIMDNMTIRNESGQPVEIRQTTAGARVFHVTADPRATAVTVSGVTPSSVITLDGGAVSGANGGGILVDSASTALTLANVDVSGNSATASGSQGGNGGGIYSAGSVTLDHSAVDSAIAANTASNQGGGVWAGTGLTMMASGIRGNKAGTDGGGAVVAAGNVAVSGSSAVSGNMAANGTGGGIDVASGSVLVNGASHVDGNSAKNAGGIMVGSVANAGDTAVAVTDGSSVSGNSSTATVNAASGDFGGGGIAAPTTGNVLVDNSQVSNNHSVGMYSGGIVVGLGSVTATNHSQVSGNTNNGPGGGIAANFAGIVTVSGGSKVNSNTGAAIGGGIVNFAGRRGGVVISGRSQVNNNVLTNAESLGQAIGVFAQFLQGGNGALASFANAVGGQGGAAMLAALGSTRAAAQRLAARLSTTAGRLANPPGLVTAGGGVGTLLAPISVTGRSQVNGNLAGQHVSGGKARSVGVGGGVFSVAGSITVDHSSVSNNRAESNTGGGIYDPFGPITLNRAKVLGNTTTGNGRGIFGGRVRIRAR